MYVYIYIYSVKTFVYFFSKWKKVFDPPLPSRRAICSPTPFNFFKNICIQKKNFDIFENGKKLDGVVNLYSHPIHPLSHPYAPLHPPSHPSRSFALTPPLSYALTLLHPSTPLEKNIFVVTSTVYMILCGDFMYFFYIFNLI